MTQNDNINLANTPYRIDDYDPAWPKKFEEIKASLQEIFGTVAISIDHVGSTSIPGMRAKPLIDTLITIKGGIDSVAAEKQKMIEAGYSFRENYIDPNCITFHKIDPESGRKIENVHVCPIGSRKAIQFIVMRDYMRAHPAEAKAYSDLKEKLFAAHPDSYADYRKGKTGFLDDMEKRALDWKATQV